MIDKQWRIQASRGGWGIYYASSFLLELDLRRCFLSKHHYWKPCVAMAAKYSKADRHQTSTL